MTRGFDSILLNPDASVQKSPMAMTNEQMAAWLNDDLGLKGRQAVTANVVRQWVSWGVLPKASAKGQRVGSGPLWERDAVALDRAKRLASIRKWNVVRESAVIAQAFIEWGHDDTAKVRRCLIAEFERCRRLLFKSVTSSTDFAAVGSLSAAKKKALLHQSGSLDVMFINDRAANWSDLLVRALGVMRSGSGDSCALPEMLLGSGIFPELIRPLASDMMTPAAVSSIQRLFAEPDEHDVGGEIHLLNATDAELLDARDSARAWLFSAMPMLLSFEIPDVPQMPPGFAEAAAMLAVMQPQLAELYPQISCGYWAVSTYVTALSMVKNQHH